MKTIDYKGTTAILLENEQFSVKVLPEIGGKIASYYHKDKAFEVIFQSEVDYVKPEKNGNFGAYDCSGFDDCYPTIDTCSVKYGDKTVDYPDHGDQWFRSYDYDFKDGVLHLFYQSDLMSYTFEKWISVTDDGLLSQYKITNTGDITIDGFYTVHCLCHAEEDMTMSLPKETTKVINVVREDSDVLGAYESSHPYPQAQDLDGKAYRLDKTAGPKALKCEKYYALDTITDGTCVAYYPSKDVTFKMIYDPAKLPYVGLWLNEMRNNSYFNYAFEPSNGFYDNMDKAKENNKYQTLQPQDTFTFDILLSLK